MGRVGRGAIVFPPENSSRILFIIERKKGPINDAEKGRVFSGTAYKSRVSNP
jgi:hypothetical protein